MRSKIKALINETNFRKEIAEFKKELRKLLHDYPADHSLLQSQLIQFYYTHFNKVSLNETIDSTIYDFDRVTMNRLRKLSIDDMKSELKKITATFSVQKELDVKKLEFPNIYMPCEDSGNTAPGYCEGQPGSYKLIINTSIDELVDILARDLRDELKSKYLLNNVWQDTCRELFSFAKHPTEIITIYKLTE
jgi:hypothetical protein